MESEVLICYPSKKDVSQAGHIPTEQPMPIDKLSDSSPESAGQEGYRGEGGEGGTRDSGFVGWPRQEGGGDLREEE